MGSLIRDSILDLIADIRCADRDGHLEYAASCRQKLREIWKVRHGARTDRNGQVIVA